jgi:hypothetical protein
MRKTVLRIFGSALLALSTIQIVAAAEHHRTQKADRAPASASERYRNSNAYAFPSVERDWSRYSGGAISAPAGH